MRRRILIIRFGSLGDVILTSATAQNLKLNFPYSEITFLTKSRFAPVVRLFAGVDEVIATAERQTLAEWYDLINRLDDCQFDTIVDLHGKLSSWLVRHLVTANTRLVYPKRRWDRHRLVRTNRIPESWPHTIDLYNSTVELLGGQVYCRRPLIPHDRLPQIEMSWPEREPSLIVAPGAAHPTKQWPVEKFARAAVRLSHQLNLHLAWVTEREEVLPVELKDISPSHLHAVANWPIERLAALCAQATAMLSNDSGLMHLASAVGTPVAAIFGPTHPALGFAPRGLGDQVIEVEESCRPCSVHGKRPCRRSEQFCFTRITPDRVVDQVACLVGRRLNASPALFVDRDGTILVNKHYRNDPKLVEFEAGAVEGLTLAAATGYKIIVISNQSGVARGLTTEDAIQRTNAHMNNLLSQAGISVTAYYYCPHHATEGNIAEFTRPCECRKPGVGMIEQAVSEHNLDLRRSAVVGDSLVDINLGRAAGIPSLLVRTGYGKETELQLMNSAGDPRPPVADHLLAAVHLLVERNHD